MEDIGSLVFYIILGIIALAGSIQGKGKKKQGAPKPVQRKPAPSARRPGEGRVTSSAPPEPTPVRQDRPASKPAPWFIPSEPSMEGRYGEPMASEFESEGSMEDSLAEEFSSEGSVRNLLAEKYSAEGSVSRSMASAFSSEGISSLGESSIGEFVHTEISDSEIGDAPAFDYEARPGADLHTGGFDLQKAVIYSALLNRKEYSY